ncbi:MAG: hypothetical protein RO009_05770 [Pseudorhodoplanes sp.]|jgi:hypothetical protein|nr:hypothetical protein [Pseudorhodoplanes sp.]
MAQTASRRPPELQKKLDDYHRARKAFLAESEAYWNAIAERRRLRAQKRRNGEAITREDYVLTQPPVYTGPPRPVDPSIPERDETIPPRKVIPVVADFLKAAREHYNFVPDRPASERDFKRAYVQTALASGLTREQIIRVYAFETGGNGTYDMQAGVNPSKPDSRAISPAMGYNQLLATNTVSLFAGHGDDFVRALTQKAVQLDGAGKASLARKIEVLRRMIAASRTVPNRWAEHDKLADTPQGYGMHAAVLDRDIGPLLQTQKLLNSVSFARQRGVKRALTGAELELMNFTGDGNGIDMVSMPQELREIVPTANFFQQRGYERNPVARRTGTVARLIADMDQRMDRYSRNAGAKELMSHF